MAHKAHVPLPAALSKPPSLPASSSVHEVASGGQRLSLLSLKYPSGIRITETVWKEQRLERGSRDGTDRYRRHGLCQRVHERQEEVGL